MVGLAGEVEVEVEVPSPGALQVTSRKRGLEAAADAAEKTRGEPVPVGDFGLLDGGLVETGSTSMSIF